LLLRDIELSGERNRSLYVLKSRGMAHSNQLREFLLTDRGVDLLGVYLGSEGVLTGSARLAQESRENAECIALGQEIEARQRELQRLRQVLESQITVMRADFQAKEEELARTIAQQKARVERFALDRREMAHSRKSDTQQGDGR
jgi:circadian clock protein KaiC